MSFAGVSVIANGKLLQPSAKLAMIYSGSSAAGSCSWYHHLLVVEGYSRIKDTPNEKCIRGRSFRAGDYRWALKFYPNGDVPEDAGFMSIYLVLEQGVIRPVKVHAQFSLIDEVDKQEPARIRANEARAFSRRGWGLSPFIKRGDLDKSEHLKDDCFTIRCDFIIAQADPLIQVPPSNISEDLNHLLATKVGADVAFDVGHETFAAHRCVLASRSSVFMAELFGPMKEGSSTAGAIQIQDMEPKVFKALLGYVYTDLMPEMESQGEAQVEEGEADIDSIPQMEAEEEGGAGMEAKGEEGGADKLMWLRQVLIAADRFGLQRLKLMCEERTSKHTDLKSVTAILGLAAQHHCHGLKEACLEFLKVLSAEDLRGVMATSEWGHLAATDLSVVNEFIAKLASKA